MSQFTWRNMLLLPSNQGASWGIYKHGTYHESSAEVAKDTALRWSPALPVLFGAPGLPNLIPPTEIPELRKPAMLALRRNYLNMSVAIVGCALAFIAVTFQRPTGVLFSLGLALGCLWVVVSYDYFFCLRHRQSATERALFYYWIKTNHNVRKAAIYSTIFMIFMGGGQLILQGGLGNAPAFDRVGAMYESLEDGQYWRLLTGPYLHYSLAHFANNSFLLILMGAAASGIIGRHTLYVFVISNVFSGWAQWVFGLQTPGSFGGVSGGVYALYGVLLSVGLRYKGLFPKGLLFYFMAVGALGVLSTDLVSPKSASVAHFTGFSFGLLYGLIVRPAQKVFCENKKNQ